MKTPAELINDVLHEWHAVHAPHCDGSCYGPASALRAADVVIDRLRASRAEAVEAMRRAAVRAVESVPAVGLDVGVVLRAVAAIESVPAPDAADADEVWTVVDADGARHAVLVAPTESGGWKAWQPGLRPADSETPDAAVTFYSTVRRWRLREVVPPAGPRPSATRGAPVGARMVAGGKTCPDCFGTGVSA